MNLNALGYIGISARTLEDWESFGTRFLGMQLVERSRGALALRMDDRKQRVIVHGGEDEGLSFYGWEVADAAALDALAAASGNIRRENRARFTGAGRRTARCGPDRLFRSDRRPARSLPRRRDRERSV